MSGLARLYVMAACPALAHVMLELLLVRLYVPCTDICTNIQAAAPLVVPTQRPIWTPLLRCRRSALVTCTCQQLPQQLLLSQSPFQIWTCARSPVQAGRGISIQHPSLSQMRTMQISSKGLMLSRTGWLTA